MKTIKESALRSRVYAFLGKMGATLRKSQKGGCFSMHYVTEYLDERGHRCATYADFDYPAYLTEANLLIHASRGYSYWLTPFWHVRQEGLELFARTEGILKEDESVEWYVSKTGNESKRQWDASRGIPTEPFKPKTPEEYLAMIQANLDRVKAKEDAKLANSNATIIAKALRRRIVDRKVMPITFHMLGPVKTSFDGKLLTMLVTDDFPKGKPGAADEYAEQWKKVAVYAAKTANVELEFGRYKHDE